MRKIARCAGEPRGEHVAERLTAGGEALDHHGFIGLHPVELQRLGKLVRGGAFLGPGVLGLGGDVLGEADQLLAALPVVGGIFGLEDRDAELGVAFLPSSVFQTANSTCRSWVLAKPSPSSIRPLRSAAPARRAALAAVEAISVA